ncbi:MAG: DinB family protein [Planctomycetota bacterium]
MLEAEVRVLRQQQQYGHGLVADIAAERFAEQPIAGMNPPAWVLGHLAYALDRHATFAGGEQKLADWQQRFGKGSTLLPGAEDYPSKEALLAAWDGAIDRMIAAVESASDETLASANTGPLPNAFPTVGDFLAFSMTAHTAGHLGQLSAWRRAIGHAAMY